MSVRGGRGPRDPWRVRIRRRGGAGTATSGPAATVAGPATSAATRATANGAAGCGGLIRFVLFLAILAVVVLVVMMTVARPVLRHGRRALGGGQPGRAADRLRGRSSCGRTWATRSTEPASARRRRPWSSSSRAATRRRRWRRASRRPGSSPASAPSCSRRGWTTSRPSSTPGSFALALNMTPAEVVDGLVNNRIVIETDQRDVPRGPAHRADDREADDHRQGSKVDPQAFYDLVTKPTDALLGDYPWLLDPSGPPEGRIARRVPVPGHVHAPRGRRRADDGRGPGPDDAGRVLRARRAGPARRREGPGPDVPRGPDAGLDRRARGRAGRGAAR